MSYRHLRICDFFLSHLVLLAWSCGRSHRQALHDRNYLLGTHDDMILSSLCRRPRGERVKRRPRQGGQTAVAGLG
jgi:hypothetical protein